MTPRPQPAGGSLQTRTLSRYAETNAEIDEIALRMPVENHMRCVYRVFPRVGELPLAVVA
ncbi:MAG: hypothetical protein ACPLY8_09300 [Thermogutta sp.]